MTPASPASIHEALKYLESRRPIEIEVERDEARRKRRAIESARQIEELNRRKEEVLQKKKDRMAIIEARSPDKRKNIYPKAQEEDPNDPVTKRLKKNHEYSLKYRAENRHKLAYKNFLRRMEKYENDMALWEAGGIEERPRRPFMKIHRPPQEYENWKKEWTERKKRRRELGT